MSTVIDDIRTEIDDSATSKYATDNLSSFITATNKIFVLNNRPIASGSEVVIVDGVILTITTQYTINYTTGIITLVALPTASVVVNYFWNDFTDDEITGFVYAGLQHISQATTRANAITDYNAQPAGLQVVIEHYALYHAFYSLAAKTMRLYKAGAGKKNVDKDNIAKKYQQQAADWRKDADAERDAYYQRQGRRNAPAYGDQTVIYPSNTPPR